MDIFLRKFNIIIRLVCKFNIRDMFHKQQIKINFKASLKNIEHLKWVHNNTFMCLGQFLNEQENKYKLIHVDSNGSILKVLKQSTNYFLIDFQIVNSQQMVYTCNDDQESNIYIINLNNYKSQRVHSCKIKKLSSTDSSKITLSILAYSPKTNIIVFSQKFRNSLRVIFYDYRTIKEENIKPVKQFCFEGEGLEANKTNDQSQIVVFSLKNTEIQWLSFLDYQGEICTLKNIDLKSIFKQKSAQSCIIPQFYEQKPGLYFFSIYEYQLTNDGMTGYFTFISI